jgi:quinol-cytochrome oxidoreductase complex cytochrome b subunit
MSAELRSGGGGGARAWLRDRVAWDGIASALSGHRAPRRNFVFYIGGITGFLLLVQVLTGILLTVYYHPDAAHAHESVERIVGEIAYGHLVRAVHVWSADMFVASLLIHAFTVLVRRSFKPPQELSWLTGLVLLALGVGLAFTGAMLPWSERAYTDARVGSDLAHYVPLVGDWLQRLMRGGDEVTSNTLSHAFGFHVAVLPAAVTAVVGMHLFLLSRRPPGRASLQAGHTIPLYPDFFVRQAVAMTGVFVIVLTLATFVDRPLGPLADPRLPTPAGALPPWYFLPAHAIVRAAPRELLGIDGPRFLVGAACVLGIVVAALPFIDRHGSRLTAWLAWLLLLATLVLSFRALY